MNCVSVHDSGREPFILPQPRVCLFVCLCARKKDVVEDDDDDDNKNDQNEKA